MKKLYGIVLSVIALFGCFIFSACGNKYADLKMAFLAIDGNPLDEIQLLIDDSAVTDKSSATICVQFLGIETKDVGKISIEASPRNLLDITSIEINKKLCTFNVQANMAGTGQVIITHKGSGKQSSINLKIGQKSNGLELKQTNYAISIGSQNHLINTNNLISLLPTDSTDEIYFKALNTVSGVQPILLEGEELVTGFNVADSVVPGSILNLYPVTRMEGYEDKPYTNEIISIHFVEQIEEIELESTDELFNLNEFGAENNPITLIANDNSLFNQSHRFNSVPVNIKYSSALEYYTVEAISDNESSVSVDVQTGTNHAIIIAHAYTNGSTNVKFRLVPKYLGNLQTIEKDLYIKADEKPTKIEVYQQNKLKESGSSIDIYNYYESSSNALGTMFNFIPKETYSLQELQTMRIVLNPSLLNAQYIPEGSDSWVGVNAIYDSVELANKYSTQVIESGVVTRNNNNVLEFYIVDKSNKGNRPIDFYYNAETGKIYSENILSTDTIYIKYAEIENTNTLNLSAEIQTFYTGEDEHLENISCVAETLNFNSLDGVKSLNVGAGYLTYSNNTAGQTFYENSSNAKVYLNRLDGFNNLSTPAYLLHIYDVVGVEGVLATSEFTITVSGGNSNPLKILQYGTALGDVKQNKDNVYAQATSVIDDYEYKQNDASNSILLIYDNTTDVGIYTITVSHASNQSPMQIIQVTVYEQAKSEDFTAVVETNEYNFSNIKDSQTETEYIFSDYECDYIVAQGSTMSMEIEVDDVITSTNMQTGYVCIANSTLYTKTNDGVETLNDNVENYISISRVDNKVNLTFNKATNISNKNYYITINFGGEFKKYSDIVTEAGTEPVTNSITFFIYEKVSIDNLEINYGEVEIYYADSIGDYFNEKTSATLALNFKENNSTIWNYVDINKDCNKVLWYDSQPYGTPMITNTLISNDELTLNFDSNGNPDIVFTVYAQITQFGKVFTKPCRVTLKKAILTDRVVITSPIEVDVNGNPYIDLEVGGSLTINAINQSSKGTVSESGIVLAVVDTNYQVNNRVVFVTSNENEIQVYSNASATTGLKLYVLSKDLLKKTITNTTSGFDNIRNLYLDGLKEQEIQNAYVVIDLHITDGVNVPYEINSADDFWAIGNDNKKDKNFKVMCDIDLSNATTSQIKAIQNFSGTIITDNNETFTISGLTLNKNLKNLFVNFAGSMQNLKFKVKYAYDVQDEGKLGLIANNTGVLTNISVEMSGTSSLTATTANTSIIFGGLVAENNGAILYTNKQVGVSGSLTIAGTGNVIFGGLVGQNNSTITGSYDGNTISSSEETDATGNDVVFVGEQSAEGTISTLVLNSELSNVNISIALVCGLNNKGTISNVYAKGEITHLGYGNVGGIIGYNLADTQQATITIGGTADTIEDINFEGINSNIHTIKSAVQITSTGATETNFVGGVVGYDEGGAYNDCHYQILTNSTGLTGGGNVGGIAGYTKDGLFQYCSVISYRWTYSINEDGHLTDLNGTADISGTTVGGLIAKAKSTFDVNYENGANQLNANIIYACSVSAYLSSEEIGGALIAECNHSFIFNAYFMGKVERPEEKEDQTFYDYAPAGLFNNVYALKTNGVSYKDLTNLNGNPSSPWGYNANLNAGYIYITKDGNNPIYEVAPTSLTAKVDTSWKYYVADDKLHLDYYDFILDTTAENYADLLNTLNEECNTYSFDSLFEFECLPKELRNVQLSVVSSRPSILSVVEGNKLCVNGVGQATLTFSSVINPNIKYVVYVDISLPMGTVTLSEIPNDVTSSIANVNIAKNKSKMFYVVSTGFKELEEGVKTTKYYYKTNQNISLKIYISSDSNLTIEDYISIMGAEYDEEQSAYYINYNNPFSITVKEYAQNVKFTFDVTPYIESTINKEDYVIESTSSVIFNLETKEGATDISLGYSSAIVYPNDITILTAYVTTDDNLDESVNALIDSLVDSIIINNKEVKISDYIDSIIIDNKIIKIEEYLKQSERKVDYNKDKKLLTIEYVLNLDSFAGDSTSSTISTMDITLKVGNNSATANLTILPQRINKIDISNYIYEGSNSTLKQINVLKQDSAGLIIIDMAPYNGYFDYLEIVDTSSGELISFTQVNQKGERPGMDTVTTQGGKGIKLFKLDSFSLTGDSSIYVRTNIDDTASTSVHTIKVTAYLNGGIYLIENTIEIRVQMLPSITVEYLKPNGETLAIQKTDGKSMSENILVSKYVAKNTLTYFKVGTQNATTDVAIEISGNATFTKDSNRANIYVLNTKDSSGEIRITLTVGAADENGNMQYKDIQLEFTVVNFVVYSATISNSIDQQTIYGNYDVNTNLTFTFEDGDISVAEDADSSTKSAIDAILAKLNDNANNKHLTLDGGQEDISLNGNTLLVEDDNKNTKLNCSFNLYLNSGNWVWGEGDTTLSYEKEYSLAFQNRSSLENLLVIKDENDFKNMLSGPETYYILGNDIELTDYTPLDVDIKYFDGNGRTITILSFAQSKDEDIQIGLFKQIHEGMVVMNVNVVYDIGTILTTESLLDIQASYDELAPSDSEIEFSSINFGGIAAVNYGIITNCSVSGDLAIKATKIENLTNGGSDMSIPFNIGGLVALNESSGYITHSESSLRIVAQANIGGFVYTNKGTIASSEFNATKDNGLIYAYKVGASTSSKVQVAGFVVSNSGSISMSYVDVGTTTLSKYGTTGNTIGNMSSKNPSAGFVYSNSGTIKQSYVIVTKIGQNHNEFSGFVKENNGNISTCYTYINGGSKPSNVNMFAPAQTNGIENCIEIKSNNNDGYKSLISGLTTLDEMDKYNIEVYKSNGFIFGDNASGATFVMNGELPQIPSTKEKVKYTGNMSPTISSDGSEKTYYGLRKIVVKGENQTINGQTVWVETTTTYDQTYGTKQNPYILYNLESWNLYFNSSNREDYSTVNYYRLVADIDFSETNASIITSNQTFNGNLQANNMTISGIKLFSSNDLGAIGLFKELVGVKNTEITNSIRNLNLQAISLNATKTDAVGVLAGVVENFNLYNITLDSENLVVIGANAVGGIAGIVRGDVDIDYLSSNASVTSTRAISGQSYSSYGSILNGKQKSENLNDVYYAGSVIGIIDAYTSTYQKISNERTIGSQNYSLIRNIYVDGKISLVGDTVGGAFGLVGEYTHVNGVSVAVSGDFAGAQYSAGIVGENRGVIENATFVTNNDTSFERSKYVSGGVVGLNLGGLINNCVVKANIIMDSTSTTVGGIVGRNIGGYVINSSYDGVLDAYIIGGIIGSDYKVETLYNRTSGSGALSTYSKEIIKSMLTEKVGYKISNIDIENLTNVTIGSSAVENWFNNLQNYYTHKISTESEKAILQPASISKVLGILIGLTDGKDVYTVNMKFENNSFVFGTSTNLEKRDIAIKLDETEVIVNAYQLPYSSQVILYIVGAKVDSMDSWYQGGYASDYMLILCSNASSNETEAN